MDAKKKSGFRFRTSVLEELKAMAAGPPRSPIRCTASCRALKRIRPKMRPCASPSMKRLRHVAFWSAVNVPLGASSPGCSLSDLAHVTSEQRIERNSGPSRNLERDLRMIDLYARQAAEFLERIRIDISLKETDRRKSEFLAVVAHELRNPLPPIRNGLQILRLRASADEILLRTMNTMDRPEIYSGQRRKRRNGRWFCEL
jgi:hypothetical protein